ncbi:MAG: pyruvate, phosphate dikinase, partial [Clostridia bacterium]|nr:pyruvate, phosphate dikinase [Clostridia bacterium]
TREHPEDHITPEIMSPLVGEARELKFVKDVVVRVADEMISKSGLDMKYHIGTMIEIPRAAITADEIAREAEFFSFGTNDLTQMTFGFSRDDAGKFLKDYYDRKIYESDPFARLDQKGVGKLVKMAADLGRQTRPDIKLGICGEHGGDPSSVEFCHKVGLSYVSCSPFRVPIARLAAAQAAIRDKR